MLKISENRLREIEIEDPHIARAIREYENRILPDCTFCGSDNTAKVTVGIVSASMTLLFSTTKAHLRPNFLPGNYWCNTCRNYFYTFDGRFENQLFKFSEKQFGLPAHPGAPVLPMLSKCDDFAKNANALLHDIGGYPHAFLLASLLDEDAQTAWMAPYVVLHWLDSFDINDLYRLPRLWFAEVFGNFKSIKNPARAAVVFHSGIKRIVETEYLNGYAARLWNNRPAYGDLLDMLMDFEGMDGLRAERTANHLHRYFSVDFSKIDGMKIYLDKGMRRAMLKLGLEPFIRDTAQSGGKRRYSPGVMDPMRFANTELYCRHIGNTYCHEQAPDCVKCPLQTYCLTGIANR